MALNGFIALLNGGAWTLVPSVKPQLQRDAGAGAGAGGGDEPGGADAEAMDWRRA